MMERVGIPAAARRIDDDPHRFSGGMSRRVVIAAAIALEPDLVIADAPTTALDVPVQAQVASLPPEIQARTGVARIVIA